MASSPKIFKTHFHARSVSLPSKPHPLTPEYDEILCRFKSSEAPTLSTSFIRNQFNGLQDLFDCLDSLLLLPETQHALAKECNRQSVHDILDGSLRLLDVCGSTKDVLLQTRDCAQELQSALRRRCNNRRLVKEAVKYLACRKNVKKTIHRVLRNLKCLQTASEEYQTFFMLRQMEKVTLSVLEPMLSFISGPKDHSLISKLMGSNGINSETGSGSEFEKMDAALKSLVAHKIGITSFIQSHLAYLDLTIQDLEEGIECLHRRLIKSRVTLLNILSH